MIRTLPRLLAFFLVPFVLFLIYLLLRRENPMVVDRWTRVLIQLVGAGLAFVILGLVITGLTAPRYEGGYLPAHVENGRIVPGRMQ